MSGVPSGAGASGRLLQPGPLNLERTQAGLWLCALAGFAALYLPVYLWAAGSIWRMEEHAHAPLVLMVVAALLWSMRADLLHLTQAPRWLPGSLILSLGLLLYWVGRALTLSIFEMASQIPVLAGLLWIFGGTRAIRRAWFVLFYLLFTIPLPGFLVDALTGPLKFWISAIVDNSLHALGYPIARQGVTLSVGAYQLLVADACSGLNSMFSLTAVGTLYMYLMRRSGLWHHLFMLLAIIPVAFVANVIRVAGLVLLTYHFGDEAGQSYLHGLAGLVLMLVSVGVLFLWDSILLRVLPRPARA